VERFGTFLGTEGEKIREKGGSAPAPLSNGRKKKEGEGAAAPRGGEDTGRFFFSYRFEKREKKKGKGPIRIFAIHPEKHNQTKEKERREIDFPQRVVASATGVSDPGGKKGEKKGGRPRLPAGAANTTTKPQDPKTPEPKEPTSP